MLTALKQLHNFTLAIRQRQSSLLGGQLIQQGRLGTRIVVHPGRVPRPMSLRPNVSMNPPDKFLDYFRKAFGREPQRADRRDQELIARIAIDLSISKQAVEFHLWRASKGSTRGAASSYNGRIRVRLALPFKIVPVAPYSVIHRPLTHTLLPCTRSKERPLSIFAEGGRGLNPWDASASTPPAPTVIVRAKDH